jgi:hypothetical protein
MTDKVTINLYSLETDGNPGYTPEFKGEIANIKKIYNGLVNASNKVGRIPPIFVVSILLIPDWDRASNHYDDELYKAKKNNFVTEVHSDLAGINGLTVEDFYFQRELPVEVREYMHNNKSRGINTDIIKTVAIINNLAHFQHLQIDSNTVVPSFEELYKKTFYPTEQKDGINASYYDDKYISAHNKMVYTTPIGHIAQRSQLNVIFLKWCKDHKDDNNVNQDKQEDNNSIYSKVFTVALYNIGYVNILTYPITNKTVYPATLNDKVYWLTDCMVTAVNMSWSEKNQGINKELLQLPAVPVGDDGIFNYTCLLNVIKKHTGNLRYHSWSLGFCDEKGVGDLRGDKTRELLLNLSNVDLELKAARVFIVNALQQRIPNINTKVCALFVDTINGIKLTTALFGCTVSGLSAKLDLLTPSQNVAIATENTDEKIHTIRR